MANEQIRTISQIKIGDNFYNIRDAQVRQVLTNLTNNVITFHSDYQSTWTLSDTIPIYASDRDTSLLIKSHNVRTWIDREDEKLHYVHSAISGSIYEWTGSNNGIIDNTPEEVEDCIVLLQYRLRTRLRKAGTFHYYMVRRPINYNTQTNDLKRAPNLEGCASLPVTAQFYDKYHPGSKEVNITASWNDRILKNSSNGDIGYDYGMVINKYVQDTGTTSDFNVTGIAYRINWIVRGTSTKQLIPADEPIINQETDEGTEPV